jgi:aryl-alcohol dehydrogenase-like predicted oxidoreductase
MTFGTEWGAGADKAESQKQFNLFLEAGGNFIDTANRYTEGSSEAFLGDFIAASGRRDEIVLATKYSLFTQNGKINDGGNHRKNLVQSVEGSLKRLKIDYIDVLYLHAWDFTTSIEEVLRALDDLVRRGKVLHIAISDTPAWVVSRANAIAELRGWSSFVGLQVEYSLITRDAERDLLPMAAALDIAVTAWAPLAGGALTGKYLRDFDPTQPHRVKEGSKRINEKSVAITREVVAIADEIGCTATQVALNWVRQTQGVVIPVVGARTAEQLKDSLGCLAYALDGSQIDRLNAVSAIEMGFPHDFLSSDLVHNVLSGGLWDKIEHPRK